MRECNVGYSHENEQRYHFYQPHNFSNDITTISPYLTMSELSGLPYLGQVTSYDGGGFVVKLGQSQREAEAKIRQLIDVEWVDQYTRAVFIEFPLYNVDANMFSVVILLFEQDRSTLIKTSFQVNSLKLYVHYFSSDVFLLICQLIFVVWVIVDTIQQIKMMRKEKSAYFHDVWNVIALLVDGASITLIILYIGKLLIAEVMVGKTLMEEHGKKKFASTLYILTIF